MHAGHPHGHHRGGRRGCPPPRPPGPFRGAGAMMTSSSSDVDPSSSTLAARPAPADPAACDAAAAGMKTACGDAFADVQARIDAGEITEAEAGAALDEARAGCAAAASSLHDACAPAAPAEEPSSLLGGFFGGFFDPSSDDASSSDDAKAACKAAAKAAKSACADGPAKVAADLAAGVITPAEASAAFADAAKACADAGKKIAEACKGPWAPPKEHPEPEPMPLPAAWMRADGADAASEEMELLQGSTLFDSCAAALAKIHEVCGADAYSKIDVTGMTPKEAAAAYKKVAKECAAAGKDVSASCGSKKPDDGSGEDGPQ